MKHAMSSFLTNSEIQKIGFKKIGENAKISRKASFFNAGKIKIGNNSRIDDFCVLSAGPGGISVGRNVHIAVFCSLIGKELIELCDFVNLSSRVAIYSSSDDFSGEWMTNPTVPDALTNVMSAPVILNEHVLIGTGSVILPGVIMETASGTGALTLVKDRCQSFGLYGGQPAKRIGKRSSGLVALSENL